MYRAQITLVLLGTWTRASMRRSISLLSVAVKHALPYQSCTAEQFRAMWTSEKGGASLLTTLYKSAVSFSTYLSSKSKEQGVCSVMGEYFGETFKKLTIARWPLFSGLAVPLHTNKYLGKVCIWYQGALHLSTTIIRSMNWLSVISTLIFFYTTVDTECMAPNISGGGCLQPAINVSKSRITGVQTAQC